MCRKPAHRLMKSFEPYMSSKMSAALFWVIGLALILPSYSQDSEQAYLDPHNSARAAVGVEPLTWDKTVADYAQNYANQRAADCNLVHSNGQYGENIAWGTGDMSAAAAVKSWVDEKAFYDYASDSCAAGKECGHYTQVVWRDSKRVGCAKQKAMSSKMALMALFCVMGLALILPSYAEDIQKEYLDAHNKARAVERVPPLTWDNKLADYALNYANKRKVDCKLIHSNGEYGENLAWSSAPEVTVTAAVQWWVDEKAFYDYNSNTCQAGKDCGHYTQVVWNTTERVGCVKVMCDGLNGALGGAFYGCNYDPPGNWIGDKPY
ncbi:hypothetical protein Tsubulata_009234 [Turnera subulata]|uniref:SCP domain-containing protein n=1 Tax=Turnera subulata TaxID=218843 RepID=A0A9Q0F320_9ROSI|nr:hypothetical protein Tsubulata_009234 [Turnera subulata]